MATMKKYQKGGNVIDSTLLRKYDPKADSVLNKPIPGKTPKQFKPKGPVKGYKDYFIKKKAKKGGSFPDLNKDGKITKADILKGRGVIKNGGKLKKARGGATLSPSGSSVSRRLSSYPKTIGKAQFGMGITRGAIRKAARKAVKAVRSPKPPRGKFKMESGGKMKSCRGGCY